MKKRMTPKQLANLKPIKKGEVRNPTGKGNPELQRLRRLTAFELQEIGSLLMNKEPAELKRIAKDPHESALRQWLANMILIGKETGDEKKFNAVADRIVGKVSDKLQIFGPEDDTDKKDDLTLEQKMALADKLAKDLKCVDDDPDDLEI